MNEWISWIQVGYNKYHDQGTKCYRIKEEDEVVLSLGEGECGSLHSRVVIWAGLWKLGKAVIGRDGKKALRAEETMWAKDRWEGAELIQWMNSSEMWLGQMCVIAFGGRSDWKDRIRILRALTVMLRSLLLNLQAMWSHLMFLITGVMCLL